MYKVLVVDDEAIISNGIKKIIPWEKIRVDKVLLADSGEEAIEILSHETADLLITDIRMVNMDGLALIEKVNEVKPEMRIIVLTGYGSFEYSQQCCRMEVHDFLLKPIAEKVLEQAIVKQLKILDDKKEEQKQNRFIYRARGLQEQIEFEKEARKLLKDGSAAAALTLFLEERGYSVPEILQMFLIIPPIENKGRNKEEVEFIHTNIKSICISMFDARDRGFTFEDESGRIAAVLFADRFEDEADEQMRQLRNLLRSELDISVRIIMGGRVKGLEQLFLSYHDALSMLSGGGNEASGVVMPRKAVIRMRLFQETISELIHLMMDAQDDPPGFLKAFDTYIRCIENYGLSVSMIRSTTFTAVSQLYCRFITDTGEKADITLADYLNQILVSDTEEILNFTREFLMNLLFSNKPGHNRIVLQAKQYIRENMAEELSVTALADRYYVTINHFSRLFKKEAGICCNEYITRVRMEAAENLLKTTTIHSGRIAEMVGYKDINYFSLAFKKYFGSSPKEHRKQIRNDQISP